MPYVTSSAIESCPVDALRYRPADYQDVPVAPYGGAGDDRWYDAHSVARLRSLDLERYPANRERVREIIDAFHAWSAARAH